MKETIIHCDICGKAHSSPGKIDFRTFSGEMVRVFFMARKRGVFDSTQMDICQPCATKIEKFLANMERGEEND